MSKLKKLFTLLFTVACLTMTTVTAYATPHFSSSAKTGGGFGAQFEAFKQHYSVFISVFMSIMLLTSIAVFVYHCFMLASSGSNSMRRTQAIQNLLTTGFCLSAQSAISLIISLVFWGFFG